MENEIEPYNKWDNICPNCGIQHCDRIESCDGVVGCPECIKECPQCGYDYDTRTTIFYPAQISEMDDWTDCTICHACAENVSQDQEGYEDDCRMKQVDILRVSINQMKK